MTFAQHNYGAAKLDIDALLQDTYLLVVELRHGTGAHSSPELWSRCVADVEHVRTSLQEEGLDRRSIELISHAQCALLDETVLACAEAQAHEDWAMETLQARFFSSHQAGESLYEDMRTVLREASAHPYVFTVFQRVLMLGFLGVTVMSITRNGSSCWLQSMRRFPLLIQASPWSPTQGALRTCWSGVGCSPLWFMCWPHLACS